MKKIKLIPLVVLFLFSGIPMIQANEFDEFEEFEETPTETTLNEDEFAEDEFEEFEESNSSDDEFNEFTEDSEATDFTIEKPTTNWNRLYWAIGILIATMIAGILVRHQNTRKLRPLFLLASVVVLGFYRGGPGIISSFQNTYLFLIGASLKWTAGVLFVGILLITYLQGKVFCGWICYLGSIQEFLHISRIKILQTEKAQKTMRIIRYVALAAILIQLTITQNIEWSKIGPFKVIFNLFSPNITGYILLGILLISSVFIYRPFCKTICPVGLILGWISKLPGAAVLGSTSSCTSCKTCNSSCQINAITREDKTSKIDNQECILCGDCISDCKGGNMQMYRNSKENRSKSILKGKRINE